MVPVTEDFAPGKVVGVRVTEKVVLGNALGWGAGAAGRELWANPARESARQGTARVNTFFMVIFSCGDNVLVNLRKEVPIDEEIPATWAGDHPRP
jgi:hypothetical protein